MTEQEWLASDDPQAMLSYLNSQPRLTGRPAGTSPWMASDRKLRLLACACFRAIKPHTPEQERIAVGREVVWEKSALMQDLHHWFDVVRTLHSVFAALLREVVGNPFRPINLPGTGWKVDPGGPFPPFRCHWFTPTVLGIAQQAYDDRDFAALPILADALEDAGYPPPQRCRECVEFSRQQAWEYLACHGEPTIEIDSPLLTHLRSPGPHVRGCWALDLLLGKE